MMYRKFLCLQILTVILAQPIFSQEIAHQYLFQVDPQTQIRVVHTINASKANAQRKKVILYLPGRASFYERNTDFISILTGAAPYLGPDKTVPNQLTIDSTSYEVWTIDYRGHGNSGGRLTDGCRQRCHINNFNQYLSDIHKIVTRLIAPHYGKDQKTKLTIVGDSLGGHLALRYAEDYPDRVHHIVLISPMLQFKTGWWPNWLARAIVWIADKLSQNQRYAIGYGSYNFQNDDFSSYTGHHNEVLFHKMNQIMRKHQNYVTGGPTYGWVQAGFKSCDYSLEPQQLAKIKCPITIFLAGADTVVDNEVAQLITSTHKKTAVTTYPGAYHNLVKEDPQYSLKFFQDLITTLRT